MQDDNFAIKQRSPGVLQLVSNHLGFTSQDTDLDAVDVVACCIAEHTAFHINDPNRLYLYYSDGHFYPLNAPFVLPTPTPQDFVFNFASPSLGSMGLSDIVVEPNGELTARVDGFAYLQNFGFNLCAGDYSHLILTLQVTGAAEGSLQVYWSVKESPLGEARKIRTPLIADGQPRVYIIDLNEILGWESTVTGIRLDPIVSDSLAANVTISVKELRLIHAAQSSICLQ